MLNLAGYGSDSDEEASTPVQRVPIPNPSPSAKPTSKKRKVVEIVVGGHEMGFKPDEDDEAAKGPASTKSGLFAFLPPPKNASEKKEGSSIFSIPKTMIPKSVTKNRSLPTTNSSANEDPSDSFFSFDIEKPDFTASSSSSRAYRLDVTSAVDVELRSGPQPKGIGDPSGYFVGEHNADIESVVENDVSFLRQTKRGKREAAPNIIEISQTDQLGDTWKMESKRNATRDKSAMGDIERMKPSYGNNQRHSIMALAYDAKKREVEIADAFANRRAQKMASRAKYGF
ncbi:hypothetical protein HDU97_008369 [Phlyctochytrium planicorne]|nr:hypothetical protein HDU97_008369 [Phlyctochytrium planicorne]